MKLFTTMNLPTSPVKVKKHTLAAAVAFSALSLGSLTVGLGTIGAAPAAASPDYYGCTVGMTEAGIAEADAIAACAGARKPENLGACVVDVSEVTGLASTSALLICQRSRRPIEVANCTIDIHDNLLESPSTKVLENCGRSVLPERYGNCVVDIAEAAEVGVDEALTQCIRAGYRPWRIQPRS
ncbi:MAG: hypothetical protein AAFO06_16875 [Cyanobacteria bacterium J06597_16]